MVREVIWQNTAINHFETIQDHLIKEWGNSANIKFTWKVFRLIELIRRYPEVGSVELRERNIRGYTVTRQVRMLYQIGSKKIYILALFDNRQNPSKKLER